MNKKLLQLALLLGISVCLFVFLFTGVVSAQEANDAFGVNAAAQPGLVQTDLRTFIQNLVQGVLTFLGIIAVIITLYGGFTYMTAGGDTSKVEKARKIIINGAIGTTIILLSYAIVALIFNTVLDATGTSQTGTTQDDGSTGGDGGFGDGGQRDPRVQCPDPDPDTYAPFVCYLDSSNYRDNSEMPQKAPGGVIQIFGGQMGETVGTVYFIKREYLENNAPNVIATNAATLVAACPEDECIEAEILSCGQGQPPAWTEYNIPVAVPDLLTIAQLEDEFYVVVATQDGFSIVGDTRERNSFDQPQGDRNDLMRLGDQVTPDIICLDPDEGKEQSPVSVIGQNFTQNDSDTSQPQGDVIFSEEVLGATFTQWTTELITMTVPVGSVTGPVGVEVDGVSGAQATYAVTCSENSECSTGCCSQNMCAPVEFCLEDVGGPCESDNDCLPGLECEIEEGQTVGSCVDPGLPYISGFSPQDGAPGTFITIFGYNFGDEPGSVQLYDQNESVVATAPAACSVVDTWTPKQILVEVPDGLDLQKLVRVTRADGEVDDTSDLTNKYFVVNNRRGPNVCAVYNPNREGNPARGTIGDDVVYIGANFSSGDLESGHYTFNAPVEGAYNDDTGNLPNITTQGTVNSISTDCIQGRCLEFEGGDGYICLDQDGLCQNSGQNEFLDEPYFDRSYSLWFKADDIQTSQMLLDIGGSESGSNLYITDGEVFGSFWSNITTTEQREAVEFISTPIQQDTWHNVVARMTAGDTYELFLDGQLVGELDVSYMEGEVQHSEDNVLGYARDTVLDNTGEPITNAMQYAGVLDEFVVFDRNISTTEVESLFNREPLETEALFSGAPLDNRSGWTITENEFSGGRVPNIRPQAVRAQVFSNGEFSNEVRFVLEEPPKIPNIDYIEVERGPRGSYVSIVGSNFLNTRGTKGTVILSPQDGESSTIDDYELLSRFPEVCGEGDQWSDNNIVIKIPTDDILSEEGLSLGFGDYDISVVNNEGGRNPSNNNAEFSLCNPDLDSQCNLLPGICKIEPNQGPPGLSGIRIFGEGFGAYTQGEPPTVENPDGGPGSLVSFFSNVPVDMSTATPIFDYWSDSIIGRRLSDENLTVDTFVKVPQEAQTGPVTVETPNGTSNGVIFDVADCREDDSVCSNEKPVCCGFSGVCMTQELAALSAEEGGCGPVQPPISRLLYNFRTGEGVPQPGVPMVHHNLTCAEGEIQSPSPYKGSDGNCVNAMVSASFVDINGDDVPMVFENMNSDSIELWQCASNAAEQFDESFCDFDGTDENVEDAVQLDISRVDPIYEEPEDGTTPVVGFVAQPCTEKDETGTCIRSDYDLNTWYTVRLHSGSGDFRSVEGFWLDGDRDGVPETNDDYSWTFKSGNDPAGCSISDMNVTPDEVELDSLGVQAGYSAQLYAENCNVMDASVFDWEWSTRLMTGGTGNAIATITNDVVDGRVAHVQTATSQEQGIVWVEGRPFKPATDENEKQPLLVRDQKNRLVIDLNIPEISYIEPEDGFVHPQTNAYVAIYGKNFGESKGLSVVDFDGVQAQVAQCARSWKDDRILVKVPKPKDFRAPTTSYYIPNESLSSALSSDRTEFPMEALYRFEDESDSLAIETINEYDAVLIGASKDEGISGNAAYFEKNLDSHAVSVIPSFEGGAGAIEFWFRPDNLSEEQTVIDIAQNTVANSRFSITTTSSGGIVVSGLVDGENQLLLNTGSILQEGQWHHVAYVADGVQDTSQLYVNGILIDGAYQDQSFFLQDLQAPFTMAFGGVSSGVLENDEVVMTTLPGFDGGLDQVALYNGAINTEAVLRHYGKSESAKGIIALYRFDEEGITVTDDSGNINNGSTTDFPRRVQGLFNTALDFDDNGSQNIAISPQKTFATDRGFSYSAWVRPTSLDSQYIVSNENGFGLAIGNAGTCTGVVCFETPWNNAVALDGASSFELGEWNHILGVVDVKEERVKLFVNGTEVVNDELTSALDFTTIEQDICIGGEIENTTGESTCTDNFGYTGELDTLAILAEPITAQQATGFSGVDAQSLVTVTTARGVTNQDPNIRTFVKSENIFPFICTLQPNNGPVDTDVSIIGDNFGDDYQANLLSEQITIGSFVKYVLSASDKFFDFEIINSWENFLIQYANPFENLAEPSIEMRVRVNPLSEPFIDGSNSQNPNGVYTPGETYADLNSFDTPGAYDQNIYTVRDSRTGDRNVNYLESNEGRFYARPVITSISPDNGPQQQWVTIRGYNFGNQQGSVFFTSANSPTGVVEAELAACGDASWSNTQLIVKVPDELMENGPAVTGTVFVEINVDGERLESNKDVEFTVTEAPLGAGLCPPEPGTIRPRDDVLLRGERFGDTQAEKNSRIVVDEDRQLGVVQDWDDRNINLTTGPNVQGGRVQVIQTGVIGQECGGFQIGNFCPGGQVDVTGEIPSNAVRLNVIPPGACQLVREEAADIPFQIIGYETVEVHKSASDGTHLFVKHRPNGSDADFIYKVGTGKDETTRGEMMQQYDPVYTTIQESEPARSQSIAIQEIASSKNIFSMEDGSLYATASGDCGACEVQTDLYRIVLDEAGTWSPEPVIVRDSEGNPTTLGPYDIDGGVGFGTRLATYNGEKIIVLGETGGQWQVKEFRGIADANQFNMENEYTVGVGFTLGGDNEPAGVFADANYMYVLEAGGSNEMALINLVEQTLDTNNTYETSQPYTQEWGGVIDPFSSTAYVGELDGGTEFPASEPGNLVQTYQCTNSAIYGCETNSDCDECGLGTSQCIAGTCTPVISKVTPNPVGVGGYLSIHGCYLGSEGDVYFTNQYEQIDVSCDGVVGDCQVIKGIPIDSEMCGITQTDNLWVIEVPDESTPLNTDDDAKTGPIRLVRTGGDNDISVETNPDTITQADDDELESTDPIYSFGVEDLEVDYEARPYVCALTPNRGNPLDSTIVRGKNFTDTQEGSEEVFFEVGGVTVENYVDCPLAEGAEENEEPSSWQNTQICIQVPELAESGPVEVRANIEGTLKESDNDIPYTVNEIEYGPTVSTQNPAKGSSNICTNAIVEVRFSSKLDINQNVSESLQDKIRLLECSEPSIFAKAANSVRNTFAVLKNALLHSTAAAVTDQQVSCDSEVDVTFTRRNEFVNSILTTTVSVVPESNLKPQKVYRVAIGEDLEGINGVQINKMLPQFDGAVPLTQQSQIVTVEAVNSATEIVVNRDDISMHDILNNGDEQILVTDVNGSTLTLFRNYFGGGTQTISVGTELVKDDDYIFATRGDQNTASFDSGLCQFDDVDISIFRDETGAGQIAEQDYFVCNGDNCKLPFDYDQAPGPDSQNPGPDIASNQHKYIAIGKSEVTASQSFVDQFERGTLNQGDNSFINDDDGVDACEAQYSISNGALIRSSANTECNELYISDGTGSRTFQVGVPYSVEININGGSNITDGTSAVGAGLVLGGNRLYTEFDGTEYKYVLDDQSGVRNLESQTLATLPEFSKWEVSWIGGKIDLTVNGRSITLRAPEGLTPRPVGNNGKFGMYYDVTGAGLATWDNYYVDVEQFNILKGRYTWSRSDIIDPLRIITLHPLSSEAGNANMPQDNLTNDENAVQNSQGDVYASIENVAEGQTKIVVEATTDAGTETRTVSQELPINIFICENPWPDFNEQFTDDVVNFMARYCRDVGDASDPTDNLPPATIVQRCEQDSDCESNSCRPNNTCEPVE